MSAEELLTAVFTESNPWATGIGFAGMLAALLVLIHMTTRNG